MGRPPAPPSEARAAARARPARRSPGRGGTSEKGRHRQDSRPRSLPSPASGKGSSPTSRTPLPGETRATRCATSSTSFMVRSRASLRAAASASSRRASPCTWSVPRASATSWSWPIVEAYAFFDGIPVKRTASAGLDPEIAGPILKEVRERLRFLARRRPRLPHARPLGAVRSRAARPSASASPRRSARGSPACSTCSTSRASGCTSATTSGCSRRCAPARPRQHRARGRARRGHHPRRRLRGRPRARRGRARRRGDGPGHGRRAHGRAGTRSPGATSRRARIDCRPGAPPGIRQGAGCASSARAPTTCAASRRHPARHASSPSPASRARASPRWSTTSCTAALARHFYRAQGHPRRARRASRGSSTSTRSSTSTSRRSAARRARTPPPTPGSSRPSASCSPSCPRRDRAATGRGASRST
jgi:hypothetical protein